MSYKEVTTALTVEVRKDIQVSGTLRINYEASVGGMVLSGQDKDPEISAAYEKYIGRGSEYNDMSEEEKKVGMDKFQAVCKIVHDREEAERREKVAKKEAPEILQFLEDHLPQETFDFLCLLFLSVAEEPKNGRN